MNKTCKPIKITTGVRVEIAPDLPWNMDHASKERWLKDWAKKFQEFLRDHRHQDVNSIDVVVEKQTVCSACEHRWEQYHFDSETGDDPAYDGCAHCGARLEKQEAQA